MKKVFVSLLAFAMMVTLVLPSSTKAQTNAELQIRINELMTLIAQLQARLGTLGGATGGSGTTAGFMFVSDLTVGSRGNEVVELQKFLVARGYLVMPAGVSYGYFGNLTRDALARFQTAQSIYPTAGYFGPITRARVNTILVTVPVPTPNPGTGGTTGGGITTPGIEGTLAVTSSNAGIRSTVYEGETQVPILGLRAEARTSDIAIQRVQLNLGNSSILYNKIFSRIYVTDGSNVFASMDLNSSNVVREGSTYFITLSGFNYVIPRNTTRDLVIKADVRNSIDTSDQGSYSIQLANNGVRGVDGAGIDHYSPASGSNIARSFSVQRSLAESSTLRVSINSASPTAQSVIASSGVDNNETDRLPLLTFDLRSERDDVTIRDLTVHITRSGSGTATASSTVYLYEGSTELDNTSINSSGNATFTDIDYVVPRNTTKTLNVRVDIRNANSTESNFVASIPTGSIVAENSLGDQISSSDVTGSATGYTIGVRNIGPEITLISKSVTTSGVPQGSGTTNMSTSTLTATFYLRIRAAGGDIVLGTSASSTPAFGTNGSSFVIYRNGVADPSISSAATSTSFSVPSGATTAGLTNSFRIAEGSEVTVPVTFQILGRKATGEVLPTGLYSVGLESLQWYDENGLNSTNFMAGKVEWRTNDVSFP